MNKKEWMKAMNTVRYDCCKCPFDISGEKCPPEQVFGDIMSAGDKLLPVCTKAVYEYKMALKTYKEAKCRPMK